MVSNRRSDLLKLVSAQIMQILKGGVVSRQKVQKLLLFGFASLIAFLPMVVMRIMRPLILIRLSSIRNDRIGSFCPDSSYLFATKPTNRWPPLTFDWYFFSGISCNHQWERMVKRKLFVHNWVRYLNFINRWIPGGFSHVRPAPLYRPFDGIFQSEVPRFEFSSQESDRALQWMRSLGWKIGQPFVCLQVRDSAYLAAVSSALGEKPDYWDYHSYRNSDIDNYREAIHYLIERNYWVFRMGKVVEKPLLIGHKKFIDYPYLSNHDDLMDIWLTRNCSIFISTGSGLDNLPVVYKKPSTLIVNALPFRDLCSWHWTTWTPKHLVWRSSRKYLTLAEHVLHSYGRTSDYESRGILVTDLVSAEIKNAVIEHEQRICGQWQDTDEDIRLQALFWAKFSSTLNFHKYHRWIHPEARAGAFYLRKMGESFFE